MKKQILLPILTICVFSAVLLGLSFGLADITQTNAQEAHIQLMQTLLPGSESFTLEPYAGEDANIASVHKGENGFVIETVTRGYADEITMFIGVSNAGKVTGLVVYEAHETPGLGNHALTDHVFLAQFLNRGGSFEVQTDGADAFTKATPASQNGEEETGETIAVDGITGATVTSKAVARCVSSAVAYVTGADIATKATEWEA